ncbi:DUF2125 domain-containing protein [Jannaschia formosa]|uniref:DUF2125 domain-containing protein n=1 Tax=Jannaschia formosa TaxID=2259592 RepID=UPI000E1B8AA0|nr:DUF2125 domain-containing protein [Jannaschia formosa]TFL20035.1 DUF2125 domain-containing protein [Jannaschia formosa]
MIRILTILVLVAALGWSGYWIAGRMSVMRGIEAGVAEARAEGWEIAWDDLSVAGFPNRFDTGLRGLVARGPGGWGVEVPRLEVMALSYRPNEVIVVPGTPLSLLTPAGPVAVEAGDLRAFAAFDGSGPPQPVRVEVEATALAAQGAGIAARISRGVVAMREAEADLSHDAALSLSDLAVEGIDAPLPAVFDAAEIDGTVTLDRPLSDQPNVTALTLRRAELAWGETRVNLTGALAVGPSGLPEGELLLELEGWRALLPLLTGLGLAEGQARLLSAGIEGLEQDGRAEIPLTLSGGMLRFGVIPLAPLPRLPAPYSP